MNRPGEIKGVFVQIVRVKIGARGDIGPPWVVRGGGGVPYTIHTQAFVTLELVRKPYVTTRDALKAYGANM